MDHSRAVASRRRSAGPPSCSSTLNSESPRPCVFSKTANALGVERSLDKMTAWPPRRTAVGGKLVNNQFWMVSEHGDHSDYVRNIKADPTVRLRIRGRWRTGVAHLLTEDDPWLRLRSLPRLNSAGVRTMGTELLTIRLDLD